MLRIIATLVVVAAFVAIYFYFIRPYLKSLTPLSVLYEREASLWQAMKHWLDGRKTIIVGFWGSIAGLGPDVLNIVSGIDLQKLLHLPEQWALWVSGIIVPFLMLICRSVTKPPAQP